MRPFPPVLADDGFVSYAVRTRSGPHVTMQAASSWADRVWTTTARGSLKARSVRAHRMACVTETVDVADGEVLVSAGPTIALDPFDPTSAFADPGALVHLVPGVAGVAAQHGDQLLGYLEAATAIPASWLPHRRLVLVTRPDRTLSMRGWDVHAITGEWARRDESRIDLGAASPAPPLPPLPDHLADLVAADGPVSLGVDTGDGPVALPGRFDGEAFCASTRALVAVGATVPGAGCVTFDDSASRRPDRKRGLMLRGRLVPVEMDDRVTRLGIETVKITTWDGFAAATRPAPVPAPTS